MFITIQNTYLHSQADDRAVSRGTEDICVTFIDLEKAYDRVPREEIWRTMRERLVPDKYVKLVQDMYTGCRTKVRPVAGESSKFNAY